MNKVILMGNLGQDPKFRPATDDKGAMCTFSVATTEKRKDQDYTEWHNIVAFGRQAEVIAQYFQKGSKILIVGRNQTRKWQDKNGTDHYSTEVMVREFEFVDRKAEQPKDYAEPHHSQYSDDTGGFDDGIPF